jgi:tetratricopeptide (TPR) repeat protein
MAGFSFGISVKRWFSKKTPTPSGLAHRGKDDVPAIAPLLEAQALQRKANEFRDRGDFARALESYQAAMAADASYMPARLGAGLVHFDQQRYSSARDLFAEAHRLQPNAADALYFLAQCHEMVNEPVAAFESYQQALRINPSFLAALRALAPLAVRLGHTEIAQNHLMAALDTAPDDLELQLLLGITLYATGRHRDSIARFDAVLDADPVRLEALINKAEALAALEQTGDAKALVDRLNNLAPERPEVMLLTARILFNTGHVDQAASKANELLALDPQSAMAQFVLGLVHWSKSGRRGCQGSLAACLGTRSRSCRRWRLDRHATFS